MAETNEITTQLGVEASSGRVISDADIANIELDPGYILADRIPPDAITQGGIVLPGAAQEDRNFGWVIAVPDDEDCRYERGDLVMWQFGAGVQLEIKGENAQEYYLVLEIGGLRPQVLLRLKAKNIRHIAKRFGFSLDKAPGAS